MSKEYLPPKERLLVAIADGIYTVAFILLIYAALEIVDKLL